MLLALGIGFSPLQALPSFVALTTGMDIAEARGVARRGIVIALLMGLVAAILGQMILGRWGITVPALRVAAALVLFVISLRNLLSQYWAGDRARASAVVAAERPKTSDPALSPLAFPVLLPPQGLAVFMLVLAISSTFTGDLAVYGIFVIVMLVNLLFMWHARTILARGGAVLGLLGAIASVLLVALSMQIFVEGLKGLLLLF